jgi:hypothetical protein
MTNNADSAGFSLAPPGLIVPVAEPSFVGIAHLVMGAACQMRFEIR